MRFSDKDIPIHCDYCNTIVEGVEAAEDHFLSDHNFMPQDAIDHARRLADIAHENLAELEGDAGKWTDFVGWGKS